VEERGGDGRDPDEIGARGQRSRDGSNNARTRVRGFVCRPTEHSIRPPSCRASRPLPLSSLRSRCNRAASFLRVRYDTIVSLYRNDDNDDDDDGDDGDADDDDARTKRRA